MKYFMVTCHGCAGKGWVETSNDQVKRCPVCDGDGKVASEKPDPYGPIMY